MTPSIGTLVVSSQGRDSGVVLAVIGLSDTHLLLANGRKRRIEKPKLKKIKHITLLDKKLCEEDIEKLKRNELTNKMLYRGIRENLNK